MIHLKLSIEIFRLFCSSKDMKQTLTKIIGISCLLLLLLNGSYQLPLDPSSELSQRLDKAALDLLRSYDEERNAKENKRRLSLQKDGEFKFFPQFQ